MATVALQLTKLWLKKVTTTTTTTVVGAKAGHRYAFSYRTLPDSVNQNLSSAIDVILRVVYLLHPRKGEKYCELVMIVSVCPFIRMS